MQEGKNMRYEGGCSTVVFGKNASATGRVILGHNEDDSLSTVQMHAVPRIRHAEGETVSFGDRPDVKIPQVPETAAFLWSEVRRPGGISFGDCFFNEYGVAVVSNSCNPCRVPSGCSEEEYLAGMGLGYAVRRLVAERAKSAREGLDIVIELVERYGYFGARTYQIADKDECWSVQVTRGKRLAAKRVPDGDVYFMPNHYTIHALEKSDRVNFYSSPDLVDFAVENGWYSPKIPGDFSDFDFAAAYNTEDRENCMMRARNAWPILGFEEEWNAGAARGELRPFSFPAKRKYGVDDAKALLRTHYEGRPESLSVTEGGIVSYPCDPHQKDDIPYTICCGSTVESSVTEFADDPAATCVHRAWRKPCTNPYVPIFIGALRCPPGYEAMDPAGSDATHFDPPASDFEYDPSLAYWLTENLIWQTELDYGFAHALLAPEIASIEDGWKAEIEEAKSRYAELKLQDPGLAAEFLSSFSESKALFTIGWTKRMTQRIGRGKYLANQGLEKERDE
jgi:dipeptidase